MELKEIITFIRKNIRILLFSMVLMAALGALANYYLPPRYYASGSLFVRRSIYPYSESHFTYEGYYGQQAAMAYSNSIIGLSESVDIRAQALSTLGIEVNESNLRIYKTKISTNKAGPQLIELVVKEKSPQKAEELWQAVANSTINTMNSISRVNDPFVAIIKVSEKPVIREGFKNAVVYTLVGAGSGLVLSISFLSFSNYFKVGKKKKK